jgi:hypothetical protein
MGFSKTFPRTVKGTSYPQWEEIFLTSPEEAEVDEQARQENLGLMRECIKDAESLISELRLKRFQTSLLQIAIALFEKRASHSVYHRENRAKEKFDQLFGGRN